MLVASVHYLISDSLIGYPSCGNVVRVTDNLSGKFADW